MKPLVVENAGTTPLTYTLRVTGVLPTGTTSAPAGTTFTFCAATSLTGTVAAS